VASIPDQDSNRAISGAVAYVLGGQADQYRNLIIVYETTQETIGALSFACCAEHTLKLLALASVVVIEDPAAPFGTTCGG
jgi:hypothetical protein